MDLDTRRIAWLPPARPSPVRVAGTSPIPFVAQPGVPRRAQAVHMFMSCPKEGAVLSWGAEGSAGEIYKSGVLIEPYIGGVRPIRGIDKQFLRMTDFK